jgi:hypothetical protein
MNQLLIVTVPVCYRSETNKNYMDPHSTGLSVIDLGTEDSKIRTTFKKKKNSVGDP